MGGSPRKSALAVLAWGMPQIIALAVVIYGGDKVRDHPLLIALFTVVSVICAAAGVFLLVSPPEPEPIAGAGLLVVKIPRSGNPVFPGASVVMEEWPDDDTAPGRVLSFMKGKPTWKVYAGPLQLKNRSDRPVALRFRITYRTASLPDTDWVSDNPEVTPAASSERLTIPLALAAFEAREVYVKEHTWQEPTETIIHSSVRIIVFDDISGGKTDPIPVPGEARIVTVKRPKGP